MKYSGYLNWKFENVFKMAEERRGRCFTFCSGHLYIKEYIGGFKKKGEGVKENQGIRGEGRWNTKRFSEYLLVTILNRSRGRFFVFFCDMPCSVYFSSLC